jgi:hypothetical protein
MRASVYAQRAVIAPDSLGVHIAGNVSLDD